VFHGGLRPIAGAQWFVPADSPRAAVVLSVEILRLLGFPAAFALPPARSADAWALVGNSLSIPAVRHVLQELPSCRCRMARKARMKEGLGIANSEF